MAAGCDWSFVNQRPHPGQKPRKLPRIVGLKGKVFAIWMGQGHGAAGLIQLCRNRLKRGGSGDAVEIHTG